MSNAFPGPYLKNKRMWQLFKMNKSACSFIGQKKPSYTVPSVGVFHIKPRMLLPSSRATSPPEVQLDPEAFDHISGPSSVEEENVSSRCKWVGEGGGGLI